MRGLFLLSGFIVLAVVLGTGETSEDSLLTKQEQLFVKDYGEFNKLRMIREARHGKGSHKKGEKRQKTKTNKQKKQKPKNKRKSKGKNKRKEKNKKKENSKRNKIKYRNRLLKRKHMKKKDTNRQGTCKQETIDAACLTNAMDAMDFEKGPMKNFLKQKRQLERQNATCGNKYNKNVDFAAPAKMMLMALGGNISNPVCGDGGTSSSTKSASSAMANYYTLIGCAESIKTDCTVEETILNDAIIAKLETCQKTFEDIIAASENCRTNNEIANDGTAACACWSKVAEDITAAKADKCVAKPTQIAVKDAKVRCIEAFGSCKKAEDAAVGLIHTCTQGEVKSLTSEGRLVF